MIGGQLHARCPKCGRLMFVEYMDYGTRPHILCGGDCPTTTILETTEKELEDILDFDYVDNDPRGDESAYVSIPCDINIPFVFRATGQFYAEEYLPDEITISHPGDMVGDWYVEGPLLPGIHRVNAAKHEIPDEHCINAGRPVNGYWITVTNEAVYCALIELKNGQKEIVSIWTD
jgi:hypothetical protein